MAKPSITNIRPPSKSPDPIWTPPKTSWDLDSLTDWQAAVDAGWAALHADANFAALLAQVNTTEASAKPDLTAGGLGEYDYIFFGVNGGEDETVQGKREAGGIIVTGNGKDTITGGNLGDVIWSGNGKDVVKGGGGNDIIFGENGADQLHGDSDLGTAAVTTTEGSITLKDGVVAFNGSLSDLPHDLDANVNGNDGLFFTAPPSFILENDKVYEVLELKLNTDVAPVGDDALNFLITVAVYDDAGVGNADHTNIVDIFTINVDDGDRTQFAVEIKPEYINAKVYVFAGNVIGNNTILDNPDDSAQTNARPLASYDDVVTVTEGEDSVTFTAGDELIGGNGPDQFVWDANSGPQNVDLVWDYNQGDGTYNPLEGDTLVLQNTGITDVADLDTFLHDIDGDGNDDLVIFFSEDHAIGMVGITDINQVAVVFA